MAKPIIKWAGGKARLLSQLLPLLPNDIAKRRYVEPFFGGGALFFALMPKNAVISDANADLMDVYDCVKSDPKGMIRRLRKLLSTHSKENYYLRRDLFNKGRITVQRRAALFLYLNKTCFNGLYRENKKGAFNVPIGSYKDVKADPVAILEASQVLQSANIRGQAFDLMLLNIQENDFMYLDPPYDGSFTAYTGKGFAVEKQKLLAALFADVSSLRGAKLMLSNANTPLIRKLYKHFNITKIMAPRSINSNGAGRNKVSELVIRNY